MDYVHTFVFPDGPKRLEDCTKEELLIVVQHLARDVHEAARAVRSYHRAVAVMNRSNLLNQWGSYTTP